MKYISLVTGSDLRYVMGVNYYIKSFIQCNSFFKDVSVNRVYSGVQVLKVDEGEEVPIGSDVGTTEYKIRRGIRSFLKKLLTDKFYPFALFRYNLNRRVISNNALKNFLSDDAPCDYIIFQEIDVAARFFKYFDDHRLNKNKKTLLIIHGEDDSGKSTLMRFKGYGYSDMKRRLYKRRDYVYNRVDKIIYISKKALNNSIVPIEKRDCVYNGAPDISFKPFDEENNQLQFVCVGNLNGGKGQDIIIEAMAMMDDDTLNKLHMTFVGDGQFAEELKNKVEEKGLNSYIDFLGVRNDVPDILKSKDVYIMPSKTEGLSMSAIEAMRAGLYLILTDTGGNKELCENDCGVICTRDPRDVREKMESIIKGSIVNRDQKIRSYNRYLISFSTKSMAEGYENILISIDIDKNNLQ